MYGHAAFKKISMPVIKPDIKEFLISSANPSGIIIAPFTFFTIIIQAVF